MAVVAGIHRANHVAPLLRRVRRVAGRAVVAPLIAVRVTVRPASGRHPGARRPGPDEVGVDGQHRLHQHRAARAAHDVNARGVAVVLLERVLDHQRDGLRVAAAVVRERLRRPDVPAVPSRVVRKDDDEALRVGRRLGHRDVGELVADVVSARVAGDVDGRLGRHLGGYIDVHLHVARQGGGARPGGAGHLRLRPGR